MKRFLGAKTFSLILSITLLAVAAAPTVSASSSQQVVLACISPPSHSSNSTNCPSIPSFCPTGLFCTSNIGGFWIWCEVSSSNPYNGQCAGDMYLFEIPGGYVHVSVSEVTGEVSPSSETVQSTDPSNSFTCTFTIPASPTQGQTNAVPTSCTGSVTFTSSGPVTSGVFTVGFTSSGSVGYAVGGFSGTINSVVVTKN